MDTQRTYCPVPVHGVPCGREELVEKRKAVQARPGDRRPAVHHECREHTFDTDSSYDQWYLCTCLQEDE